MSKPIDDFAEYITGDVLGHVSKVTAKKMFGGYGLYHDGHIFGIITSEVDLYFKVNKTNQARYEAFGSQPFIYSGHKNRKPTPMPYWLVPERVREDRELIEEMVLESAALSKNK